jgi:hypothetical protein
MKRRNFIKAAVGCLAVAFIPTKGDAKTQGPVVSDDPIPLEDLVEGLKAPKDIEFCQEWDCAWNAPSENALFPADEIRGMHANYCIADEHAELPDNYAEIIKEAMAKMEKDFHRDFERDVLNGPIGPFMKEPEVSDRHPGFYGWARYGQPVLDTRRVLLTHTAD